MNTKPAFPKDLLPTQDTQNRLVPVAVAAGLVAAGALLWRARPHALDFPDPVPLDNNPKRSIFKRFARKGRDGLRRVAPDNLSVSLGRSMVIAGGALLVTRLLDELSGD